MDAGRGCAGCAHHAGHEGNRMRRKSDGGNRQGQRRERISPSQQEGEERHGGRKIERHRHHEKHCGHEVYPLNFAG